MDYTGAAKVAHEVQQALTGSNRVVVRARNEGRTWSLAIRRIQSMGLHGCFDVATQTVIVDPRHIQTLKHELCHWLLGHEVEVFDTQQLEAREKEVDGLMKRLFS